MKQTRTHHTIVGFLVLLCITYCASFAFSLDEDLEIIRRGNAISERIQSQVQELLGTYYDRKTYIVNVNTHLERIMPPTPPSQQAQKFETPSEFEDIELPGLPIVSQSQQQSNQPMQQETIQQRIAAEQWLFSDKFRIKYIEVLVSLDQQAFTEKDLEFVKAIVRTRAGLDDTRGDALLVSLIPFPKGLETDAAVQKKKEDTLLSETKNLFKKIYSSILLMGIILGVILLVVLLFQLLHLRFLRKRIRQAFEEQNQLAFPRQQIGTGTLDMNAPQIAQQAAGRMLELPQQGAAHTTPEQSEQSVKQDKYFYELRQLMVTTVVGNPQLSSDVFKKWIEANKDDGMKQIAGFLRATDPQLIGLVAEHVGKDVASQVSYDMAQTSEGGKEDLIEMFKKFREEFQKEQWLNAQKAVQQTGDASGSMFQFLKQLPAEIVYHILKEEPVSIIAIALAQVPADTAHLILNELPQDKQMQIPVEIAKIKKIPLSVYKEIADKLAKKAMDVDKIRYVATDGIEALINILEQSSPEMEHDILSRLSGQDILLAEEVRKVYITFDELVRLPDKVLADVVRGFDRDVITRALLNASPELKEKIITNLPARIKIIVTDSVKTLEESGEVPDNDVLAARRTLVQKIRELAKTGKLDLKKILASTEKAEGEKPVETTDQH